MSGAFILGGLRTPRAKASKRGALATVPPLELLAGLQRALPARTGLDPGFVDDVLAGCASQVDGQGANIARTATLLAGWGEDIPGATINRFCASGIDAVNTAAARVSGGDSGLIVAGGVESVSQVPLFADRGPLFTDPAVMARVGSVHMGIAADLVASLEGYERDELDDYAFRTREKARRAWEAGRLAPCVAPVLNAAGAVLCDHDEYVSYAPTRAELAALPAAFGALGAEGQDSLALARYTRLREIRHLHTKATSPPMADAAALVLVGSAAAAARAGMRPRARIVATATCAVEPVIMLTAGQLAIEQVLRKAGLSADDVELFEFAEAFSALCLKLERELRIGDDRLNVNGGTMALGHAFGATGAILILNLVEELERRGARYGVAAVSSAAGLGVATLVERVTN